MFFSSPAYPRRVLALMPLFKLLLPPLIHAVPFDYRLNTWNGHQSADDSVSNDPAGWIYLVSAAVLVALGGAFAGLTIAYVLLYSHAIMFEHSFLIASFLL
jgi:hypothetical protein